MERSYDQVNKLDIIQSESDESFEALKTYYLDYFQKNNWNILDNKAMVGGGYRINALKGSNNVGIFLFPKDGRYLNVLAQHYE